MDRPLHKKLEIAAYLMMLTVKLTTMMFLFAIGIFLIGFFQNTVDEIHLYGVLVFALAGCAFVYQFFQSYKHHQEIIAKELTKKDMETNKSIKKDNWEK